ncbi:MAG: sortase [Promicromonosporaceae bacterium]|nr:sortase [Promicromonosporaceae bacterium]
MTATPTAPAADPYAAPSATPSAPPGRRPPRGWTPPGTLVPRKGMPPKPGSILPPAPGGPRPAPPSPFPMPAPRPERAPRTGPAIASAAMWAVAALCLWSLLQLFLLGGVSEQRAQDDLRDQLRLSLAEETAPLGGLVDPGTPVALLQAPAIHLEQVVVEGTAPGDTQSGPGHLRSSPLPGQRGSSVILGRAATYGAPFRSIADLHPGDVLTATTSQGVFRYRVERVRRTGDPLPVPLADGGSRLTLVTSEGIGPTQGLSPSDTLYVDALLQGKAVGAPAGRAARVPDAEKPMGVDLGVLPLLLLAAQGLLLAAVAVGLARRWVPARVTWVLGVPVLLVFVWLTSELATRLLPNIA